MNVWNWYFFFGQRRHFFTHNYLHYQKGFEEAFPFNPLVQDWTASVRTANAAPRPNGQSGSPRSVAKGTTTSRSTPEGVPRSRISSPCGTATAQEHGHPDKRRRGRCNALTSAIIVRSIPSALMDNADLKMSSKHNKLLQWGVELHRNW